MGALRFLKIEGQSMGHGMGWEQPDQTMLRSIIDWSVIRLYFLLNEETNFYI